MRCEWRLHWLECSDNNRLRFVVTHGALYALFGNTTLASTFQTTLHPGFGLFGGAAVVTASHYPMTKVLAVPCSFTTSHEMIIDSLFPVARAAIVRFRSRGGEFACHLAGHCHRDDVVSADGTLDQCDVVIGAASSSKGMTKFDNTVREAGRFSQDLFNLVTIDRGAGTVTLRRIGADEDGDGTPRRTMTFDYRAGRILSEG